MQRGKLKANLVFSETIADALIVHGIYDSKYQPRQILHHGDAG